MESYGEYTDKGIKKKFKIVSGERDAYLLGFLACDGGYVVNRKWPFMMVSGTEKYIIDWVNQSYIPDANIIFAGKKSSKKVNATNDVFEIRWAGKASKQFSKFGIFCKKPERRIVNIPNRSLPEYIAGCIDADGFITVTHRKDCRTPRLRFFITHAGEKFLSDLQEKLSTLGVTTTLRQHGDNVWRLQAQNTEQNKAFLSTITTTLRNKRKVKVLNEYLKEYYVPQESDELLENL